MSQYPCGARLWRGKIFRADLAACWRWLFFGVILFCAEYWRIIAFAGLTLIRLRCRGISFGIMLGKKLVIHINDILWLQYFLQGASRRRGYISRYVKRVIWEIINIARSLSRNFACIGFYGSFCLYRIILTCIWYLLLFVLGFASCILSAGFLIY